MSAGLKQTSTSGESALALAVLDTPVGPLALAHDGSTLFAAEFHDTPGRLSLSVRRFYARQLSPPSAPPAWLAEPWTRYFAGDHAALDALPLATPGGDFERSVWAQLRRIPTGETRSYGDIARALGGQATGDGGLARSVGTANARNPLAVVVPCHRVIGASGALTGYAGGLHRKRWLLEHEGAIARSLL
jgi:methylated-DNA-[protein]-cysteine S-methyltransferase